MYMSSLCSCSVFRVVRAGMDGFLSNVCPSNVYVYTCKYICTCPHCVPFCSRVEGAGMDGFLSYVCPCMYIYIYIYIYLFIYIYMQTYMHMCVNIYLSCLIVLLFFLSNLGLCALAWTASFPTFAPATYMYMYVNTYVHGLIVFLFFARVVRAGMDGFLSNVCPCIYMYIYIYIYIYIYVNIYVSRRILLLFFFSV